jgi:hypothetical protein
MGLQPSRPGFMLVGALVFLALPFLWATFAQQTVDMRFVAACIIVALVFIALAVQYHRQLRGRTDTPPAA